MDNLQSLPCLPFQPRGGWRNFNDSFARNFKPGCPPVSAIQDPTVITSPDDWVYNGQLAVSSTWTVTIKTLTWRISELLADSAFQGRFAGGTWIHGYLGTYDYHRVHTPVGGIVVEAGTIMVQHYARSKRGRSTTGKTSTMTTYSSNRSRSTKTGEVPAQISRFRSIK
ncbi:hypothetical protein MMC16_005683 [Acarospora aff. strigata]|nr:hypothetical protein [Acarospora aff. strigata]